MSDICEGWTNGRGHYADMHKCVCRAKYIVVTAKGKSKVCARHAKVIERKDKTAEFFLIGKFK